MRDTREVVRGIGVTDLDESGKNGKYRAVTDADQIAGMYSQSGLDALVEAGVLIGGEWKSTKVEEGEAEDTGLQGGGAADGLPDGFPYAQLLSEAGFDSLEKVKAASDEELIGVEGIAAGRLKEIRKATK